MINVVPADQTGLPTGPNGPLEHVMVLNDSTVVGADTATELVGVILGDTYAALGDSDEHHDAALLARYQGALGMAAVAQTIQNAVAVELGGLNPDTAEGNLAWVDPSTETAFLASAVGAGIIAEYRVASHVA